jgi:hypothetical protein
VKNRVARSPSLFYSPSQAMQNLDKIEKIFNMLGSDSDGECLNALALIKRNLKSQNLNWNDLSNRLFGGSATGGNSFREEQTSRYHDMAEEMRRQRRRADEERERERERAREQRNREYQRTHRPEDGWPNDSNETWKHKNKEESKSYGSGRYQARDPYPEYPEHKTMCAALVNLIMTGQNKMTEWETGFVKDIYNKNICMAKSLSTKQDTILRRIYGEYIKQ